MSHAMQDYINQGFSWNFDEAMVASIENNILVFLGNYYNACHDYVLEVQEHMHHPIAFHAEMMGNICTCINYKSGH